MKLKKEDLEGITGVLFLIGLILLWIKFGWGGALAWFIGVSMFWGFLEDRLKSRQNCSGLARNCGMHAGGKEGHNGSLRG
jgi:hypothetical protein